MNKENQKLIIYGGAVLLAYFGVLRPILNKLGITKSKEAKTIDEQENKTNKENPFSPVFYKLSPSGSKLLTGKSADYFAKQIYDAMGVFGDDEAKIYGVFRSMKTQSQVSFLAERFQVLYKTDLLDYLKRGYSNWNTASGLNANELNQVITIVNKLPKYN
jgi:hypothetical protein